MHPLISMHQHPRHEHATDYLHHSRKKCSKTTYSVHISNEKSDDLIYVFALLVEHGASSKAHKRTQLCAEQINHLKAPKKEVQSWKFREISLRRRRVLSRKQRSPDLEMREYYLGNRGVLIGKEGSTVQETEESRLGNERVLSWQ